MVAVLADLHVGSPWNGMDNLARVVARTNAESPDAVVLLGDYMIQGVSGAPGARFTAPETFAPVLGRLRAPLGVVSVLGNHDWWFNGLRVRRSLEASGIRVLENEAMLVRGGPERVWLAGLADLMTRQPDVAAALSGVPPGEVVLMLSHSPDVFPEVPASVTLTVAGHTHGGQVRLPLLGAPIVPSAFGQRYARGLVVENGRTLFVTSGVGTSILPVRFGVPPEIVVLELGPALAR